MASLDSFMGDFTWPYLLDMDLANFSTNEQYFVAFLLRDRGTFNRLSLSDIELLQGTWKSTLEQLSGQLSELRTVRFHGMFPSFDTGWYELDFPDSRRISYRDAVENFVLRGGQWPDLTRLERETCYPEDAEEYEPPGLQDDEPDPENPDLVHKWDAFDSWM